MLMTFPIHVTSFQLWTFTANSGEVGRISALMRRWNKSDCVMVSAYSLYMSFNYTIHKQFVLHIWGEKYQRRRRFCYTRISVTFYSFPFQFKCFMFFHDSREKILLQIIRCMEDFLCLKVYNRSSESTPKQMSPFVDTQGLWTPCFRSTQIF
jgi:hypothetical protein